MDLLPSTRANAEGGEDDILSEPVYTSSDVALLLHVHPDTLALVRGEGETYGVFATAGPVVAQDGGG